MPIAKRAFISALVIALLGGANVWVSAQDLKTKDSSAPDSALRSGNSASQSNDQEAVPVVLQHRNPRYKLHSADVLELNFPFTPEFNQTVTVQPDGYISLRGLESILVEGKTVPEVTSALRSAYTKILHDPEISVELKDFEKPYFIVGGQVGHPGKFELRGDTTTVEAVAIAGGFKESAKHSQVYLFHRVPDGWIQVKKLNLKKMLKNGNLKEDAYLQPGDFLYVPQNTMSKIARFIPTSSLGLYANPMP
jgi:polysaccharide export outer membrane protein